jgi:hypothetical protein
MEYLLEMPLEVFPYRMLSVPFWITGLQPLYTQKEVYHE